MEDLQREIIAMQEQTKRMVAESKANSDARKLLYEMKQAYDEMKVELTELELKYSANVQGPAYEHK